MRLPVAGGLLKVMGHERATDLLKSSWRNRWQGIVMKLVGAYRVGTDRPGS